MTLHTLHTHVCLSLTLSKVLINAKVRTSSFRLKDTFPNSLPVICLTLLFPFLEPLWQLISVVPTMPLLMSSKQFGYQWKWWVDITVLLQFLHITTVSLITSAYCSRIIHEITSIDSILSHVIFSVHKHHPFSPLLFFKTILKLS